MNPNTQLLILRGIQLFSLLLIGIFIYVMVKEPRTLWSGVSFLFALAGLGILFLLLIFRYSDWLQAHTPIRFLLLLLMILFMLAVVLFPLLLVLTFFIQGIQVLRREGLRPQNLLSLLFAILLFAYLVFWPQLGDWHLCHIRPAESDSPAGQSELRLYCRAGRGHPGGACHTAPRGETGPRHCPSKKE